MSDVIGVDPAPGDEVIAAIERTLSLAQTWVLWDGRACLADDRIRIYTPHKAIRRTADHLIDHIAEVEALLGSVPTIPDHWHASGLTLDGDWARFTEADLNEAQERLRRLASILALLLRAAGPDEWDRPRGENQTLRQIAEHVGTAWYAEQVGALHGRAQPQAT